MHGPDFVYDSCTICVQNRFSFASAETSPLLLAVTVSWDRAASSSAICFIQRTTASTSEVLTSKPRGVGDGPQPVYLILGWGWYAQRDGGGRVGFAFEC